MNCVSEKTIYEWSFGFMIPAFILILVVYGGLNFYIAYNLYRWVCTILPSVHPAVFYLCYAVFAILPPLSLFTSRLSLPVGLRSFLDLSGSVLMGVLVYLLLAFLLKDIIIGIGKLFHLIPHPTPTGVRFAASGIALILAIGISVCGILHAGQIQTKDYTASVSPKALSSPMRIVLISDLHLGAASNESNLPKIVDTVNAQRPDLICIAGDIFNGDYLSLRNPDEIIRQLQRLSSTYGVYACSGNHDRGITSGGMKNILEKGNIRLLNNQTTVIGEKLLLIGRSDAGYGGEKRTSLSDMVSLADNKLSVVVLDHNPAHITEYANDVDLILCGHTHRGQIFPANLVTKATNIVDYGYYRKDKQSPQVIVTSGVGTWGMPMRICSDNEVVTILIQ